MTQTLIFALTLAAAVGSGVMGGLFFTFSTTVMTALGRLPPPQGIAAMNAINSAILNPLFALVFFGTPLVCVALAIRALTGWSAPGAAWLLAGAVAYVVGSFVVTIVFNVPLNNALAAADPGSADAAALWTRYLKVWTNWNHVRTVACLAAMAAFIVALWLQGGDAAR